MIIFIVVMCAFIFSTHDSKVLKYTRHTTWLEDGLIKSQE